MPQIGENGPRREDERQRLDAYLGEMLDLTADARQARLEQIDEALRPQLRSLLDAAFDPRSPLVPGGAASPSLLEAVAADAGRRRVGPYRLTREIGRGGMGVVYLADRDDGHFERQVAVKLLRLDAASRDLDRFARERQILAGLDHPGIARLYDGGVTEGGEPYFVMEHVDGLPIDRYCREQDLDIPARVRLVEEVCVAVAEAHRRLVVHRDLKPTNILVDARGAVKLLDFGIARPVAAEKPAAEPDLPGPGPEVEPDDGRVDGAIRTAAPGRLTLQYASPEQLAGEPVTTASDVYQLGLLLFELVAGSRPYELSGLDLPAARERVREGERRSLRAATEGRVARGDDLEAILDRALATEPNRRYPSVERLEADLRRYRQGLPVEARASSPAYRLRRFVGRHPLAVALTALAAAVLVGLTTAFTVRLASERDARQEQALRAERAGAQSERVVEFLAGLFRNADPSRAERAGLTARELLGRGVDDLDRDLGDQPQVKARLLAVAGDIYLELGLFEQAAPLLEESLRLRQDSGDPLEVARSRFLLGKLHRLRGDFDAARIHLDAARPPLEASGATTALVSLLTEQAHLDDALGKAEDALRLRRRVLEIERDRGRLRGQARASLNLSNSLRTVGRTKEARRHLRSVLDIFERLDGPNHPNLATPLTNLAILESRRGADEMAVKLNQRALALAESAYGGDHERVIQVLNNLGINHARLGDFEGAKAFYERALAAIERAHPRHPRRSWILNNLGSMEWKLGRPAVAERYYRRALELIRADLPPEHPKMAIPLVNLGESLLEQSRTDEAESALLESRGILLAAFGEDHVLVSYPNLLLAEIREEQGDLESARALLEAAVGVRRAEAELDPEDLRLAETRLAEFLGRHGEGPASPALDEPVAPKQ